MKMGAIMDVSSAKRLARRRPILGRWNRASFVLTPYAGANRIRFNGTLSAGSPSGAGTPVKDGI
jgi:hypothetical protein